MLVPSVTKYNEIYMPDVQTLEESHRMSNITYKVYNSTFNYNGMYYVFTELSIGSFALWSNILFYFFMNGV